MAIQDNEIIQLTQFLRSDDLFSSIQMCNQIIVKIRYEQSLLRQDRLNSGYLYLIH